MRKTIIIAIFYFILIGFMVHGEENPNLTDPYILLSTDTAQLQFVQSICKQFQFPDVKTVEQDGKSLMVIGPFLHGVMAYENLQVIKMHIPLAELIRLSKGEQRISFIHPSLKINSYFLMDSRLGQIPTSTYLSQEFSNHFDLISSYKSHSNYLEEIQTIKTGLADSDPKKGIISKFEADYLYRSEFAKINSGQSSFNDAKVLYQKLVKKEIESPREIRGHSAIKLIFIDQAEKRTEVWCPNFENSTVDDYFKVYQTCRDSYNYLDDERFRPEAAVHMVAKLLELAKMFNIGNCDDVRKAIESVKSDLPSSETIRSIEQPIMSDMEFIVHKYRYNMSTLDLMYGETYYYEKNYQIAYNHFKEVSEKYKDIPRTYLASLQWQGLMAMNLGMNEDAIKSFQTVINDQSPENNENTFAKRNPRSNSGFWLGQIYLKQNKKEEVKTLYEWILNKYPECIEKEFIEECLLTLGQ